MKQRFRLRSLLCDLNPNKKIKEELYENTKLKGEFIGFLLKLGVPKDRIPYYNSNSNYRMDWNILNSGIKVLANHFNPLRVVTPEYGIARKMYGEISEQQAREITNWLNYVSVKTFRPELLMLRNKTHNGIAIRICASKLDKLTISHDLKCIMFEEMLETYKVRLNAYKTFYDIKILELPF